MRSFAYKCLQARTSPVHYQHTFITHRLSTLIHSKPSPPPILSLFVSKKAYCTMASASDKIVYPTTKTVPQVDIFHGTKVFALYVDMLDICVHK